MSALAAAAASSGMHVSDGQGELLAIIGVLIGLGKLIEQLSGRGGRDR